MTYRPDIDGLRAIAVLTVVLFHAEVRGVDGGFIGVDVFFVISGYLITGIITRAIEDDSFSIVGFYVRRARRILPALFVMMAIVAVFASLILIPSVYERFAMSAAAAAVSLSNFFFYESTGYFGGEPYQLPLLHTWSLGVEEQFYLAFPAYLLVGRKLFRRVPMWALILPVAVVSFAIGMYQVRHNIDAAFFLPFGRVWELALGGLIAVGAVPALRHKVAAEVLAVVGVGMILFSAVRFSETLRFPGEYALVPCVGAALVIYAGLAHRTWTARALSLRPMVFVGLISYSLYLWHWPVLVLTRAATGSNPEGVWRVIQLAFIVAISVASWRFVERPFRRSPRFASRRVVFGGASAAIATFLAFGFVVVAGDGVPQRLPEASRTIASAPADINPYRARCDARPSALIRSGDVCVVGTPDVPASVAIVGDSFADAVVPGIEAAAKDAGKSAAIMTFAGCPPLAGVTSLPPACGEHMQAVAERVSEDPAITSVILVGRWSAIVEGSRQGATRVPDLNITDEQSTTAGPAENRRVFARAIDRTVDSFGDKDVYVVAYLPEQLTQVPQTITSRMVFRADLPAGVSRSVYDARQANVRRILTEATADGGFEVLDAGALCDERSCPITADGVSLYVDDNHLSRTGAVRAHGLFAPAFQ